MKKLPLTKEMASENSLNMVCDIGTLSNNVVHTVRRPYKCTFCIKTFTVHSNLIKHTRTHTGERPFKCEVCEKAFANPSNLTRHRRLHTGIRPYTCGFCQKGFRDSSNLKYHLKTHLNDKFFKCQQCGDIFSVFADYCAHMKIHFDITSELLYNSRLSSSHTKASTSQTDDGINNSASAAMKLISLSSSFPSFTSSNEETNEEIWRLSLAASSISSDVQNYNNSCDIASVNKSLDSGHQNFSSFKNQTSQGAENNNSIIPSLEIVALSKDFDSNSSANQDDQQPKLLSVGSFSRDLILSQEKSAIEIVDLDDKVPFIKQENQLNSSASEEKDWNLFSIKEDGHLDNINANVVPFKQSYPKLKSPVFQFGHLEQAEEIDLQDDSTCTLDELANKLTQCVYCERIFSLEDSSKQLDDEKPYCGTCNKMSASKIHLTTDSPGPQEKNLLCLLCDTLFEEPGQLKQHICVTNINGKRYNPCLKYPETTGLNTDRDFKGPDGTKSDFIVNYEDSFGGIQVLETISCESQNLMVDTLSEKGEKVQDSAAVGELKLLEENSNEPKKIELKKSNMESAELVRIGSNEDKVIIDEKVWQTNSNDNDKINLEKRKCVPTELIQSTSIEMNVLQDDNLLINDDQADLTCDLLDEIGSSQVKLGNSKNSLTINKPKDSENDSSCRQRKNSNTCSLTKNKLNRTVLNKSRKLIRNRLKNPLQQLLSKQEKPSLFRSSHELRFKCRYCDKAFSIQGNLIKHIRIHTGEKPFKCTFCTAAFANPSNLTRHVRTHTGEKPYKCLHCERRFRASSNLRSHQRTHFKYPPYKCNMCQEKFSMVSHYRLHLKSHQNQPSPNHANADMDNITGTQVNAKNLINTPKISYLSNKEKAKIFTFISNDDKSNANLSNVTNANLPNVTNPSLKFQCEEKEERSENLQTPFPPILNNSLDFSNQFIDEVNNEEDDDSSLLQPNSWQKESLKANQKNNKQINQDNIIVIDLENNSLDSYGHPHSEAAVVLSDTFLNESQVEKNQLLDKHFCETRNFENFYKSKKTPTSFNKNFNLGSDNEISLDQMKLQSGKSPRSISFKSLGSSAMSKSHPYRCVYCSKGFTVHCNLVKHIRIHTGEKPFVCKDCGKAFANPSNLTRHLRTHTGERPYKCNICHCTFRSSSNLKIHMNIHSSATHEIKCSFCDQKFIQNREFKIHLRTHMANRKIKGCSSNLTGMKTNHGKSFYGGRIFSSSFLRFRNPSGLTKQQSLTLKTPIIGRTVLSHKQKLLRNSTFVVESSNNNPVGMFQSDSSEKISSKVNLKCHTGRSQFVNGKENQTSKTESFASKTKEISTQHLTDAVPSNNIIKCNVKLKSSDVTLNNEDVPNCLLTTKHEFMQTSIGRDHVQIEKESCLNELQNEVTIQEQAETRQLEENMDGNIPSLALVHHSPNMKFDRKDSLLEIAEPIEAASATSTTTVAISMRTSKLHKCRFCGRMFPSRCNLIKHVRTHTGEKPFRCKCCRAAFANPSNLTRHVRTHTGEKPYSCPHCNKTFRASSNLKQHLRTHREGSPYKCRYCSRTFFMFSNFKLHMRSHCKSEANLKVFSDPESSSSLTPSSQNYFHSKSSVFADKDTSDYNNVPKHSISSLQTIFKSPQESKMTHLKQKQVSKILNISNKKEQLCQSSKDNDMDSCNTAYSIKLSSVENVGDKTDLPISKPLNYSSRNTEPNLTSVFSQIETVCKPVSDNNHPNQMQWPESRTIRPDLIVVPTYRRKQKKSIYKCVYCDKTFTVSSNLTKHVRTHTGEKPFQCRFCPKAFANPSNLIRHERIHTGEQPYQCPYCPQKFSASGNLKEHVKKHISSEHDGLLLSKTVVIKKKQKMGKEKNSKNLCKDNFLAESSRVEQNLSLQIESASASANNSDNFSSEDNSKNEDNQFMEVADQLNILDESVEESLSSRNKSVSVSSSETSSLKRTKELSVFSFDSLILNSLEKSVEGSESVTEKPIKKEEMTQEIYCASSETAEINNVDQEIVKKESKEYSEEEELKNLISTQNDFLDLFKRNSAYLLNGEKSTNSTDVSEINQSIDSILCKKEFSNSVSSNTNSFENSFSQPNEKSLHECQICHLAFVHFYELNKHLEIHAFSPELEIKEKVSHNQEFSLDYQANSRENSSENIRNENESFVRGELYICKYGCQTFGSYAELNSHLKIHGEDKMLINNVICVDDDDDNHHFQQNQKENLLSLDSLNNQLQQAPAVELDLYSCRPFMSLDSDQHLMVEHAQPNISPGESSMLSSQNQSKIFKETPITFHTKNLQKPHHCPFCIKSFSKRSQLTKHIRTHTGETPHKCRYCGTGFANPSNLTRHIRTHTGEKPYQCPICKKAFGNSSNMKEHLKTHSKISLYKCKYCRKKFSLFHTYKMHLKNHHKFLRTTETNKKGGSPPQSSIVIDNNSNSSEEIVELYEERNDKSLFSLSTSTLKYERDRHHFNISDLNISNQDEICEIIKMNDATSNNCHSIVYLDDTSKVSEEMQKTFPSHYESSVGQQQSEQLIHLVDFYQTFSPNSASNKKDSNILPNQNQNFIERPNKSLESGMKKVQSKLTKSNQLKSLTRHSHPLRSHVCSYCEKSFTIHSNLTKHIRTHTGEKPFKCHTCEAAFANPSNLTRHVRTHTGEKPYLCPYCSKSFRASSNLKVHLKMIHTQY